MEYSKDIKEIIVFANKDADDYKTWSNVPYFFIQNLEARGIKIHRVTLWSSHKLIVLFNKIISIFFKNTTYNFYRSSFNFLLVRKKIKTALKKYPNSDLNLFFTYSFSSAGLTNKPSVLFCDWTYDYYFNKFSERKPDVLERTCIKRENNMIEKSDFVFSLFPGITDYMLDKYNNKNIFYLGNVVNSVYKPDKATVLAKKKDSNSLLFVGAAHYKAGAECLIRAFDVLKQTNENLTLHVVGMDASDFENLPNDVFCYGYLDKGLESDRNTYYSLLESAKIFINTTPKWGSFSASLEALYFYNPVIVSPYDEFVRTFGEAINMGVYCEVNEPEYLMNKIQLILNAENYTEICENAHKSVQQFGWDEYVERFLKKIKKN